MCLTGSLQESINTRVHLVLLDGCWIVAHVWALTFCGHSLVLAKQIEAARILPGIAYGVGMLIVGATSKTVGLLGVEGCNRLQGRADGRLLQPGPFSVPAASTGCPASGGWWCRARLCGVHFKNMLLIVLASFKGALPELEATGIAQGALSVGPVSPLGGFLGVAVVAE